MRLRGLNRVLVVLPLLAGLVQATTLGGKAAHPAPVTGTTPGSAPSQPAPIAIRHPRVAWASATKPDGRWRPAMESLTFARPASAWRPLGFDGSAPGQVAGQAKQKGTPGHIFFIIPAYNVEYIHNVPPLTSHEKLMEFVQDAYDPIGLAASGIEAALLEHDRTGYCGYGPGWGGYGKCFGAALIDANISGFVGDYMMPSILHQDPRYFRLGQGSLGARVWYSLSRVFIMRKDSGGWTFGSGAMIGTAATGALSNLYYPKTDRGWGLSLSRMGIDLMGAAIFNLEAEFWPDIVSHITGRPLTKSLP